MYFYCQFLCSGNELLHLPHFWPFSFKYRKCFPVDGIQLECIITFQNVSILSSKCWTSSQNTIFNNNYLKWLMSYNFLMCHCQPVRICRICKKGRHSSIYTAFQVRKSFIVHFNGIHKVNFCLLSVALTHSNLKFRNERFHIDIYYL